ncbi:hypothetical protein CAPN002_25790 [Capnocytophaga stomatis]|uniref:M23 family metallopeptidase n=1 Tax=Capnocytophaga stomatis TaxID=1848904 RepID=UPI001950AD0D|nr:M23 family metallopeptidase [Capnocytophaga stomatis]GIJ95361.1 hypothetical protein CAPN002_25790 [Capnocytophaga stomatis]
MQIKTVHILLFFFCNLTFAQFNSVKKEEKGKYKIVENIKEKTKKENSSTNKFWKLFSSEKKELKREIDSLKRIIEEKNKEKPNTKRIEDSIITSITKKIFTDTAEKKRYDEKKKVTMPIQGKLHITSPFGERFHPILKKNEMHNGIDIRANNELVYSVLEGIISDVGKEEKGGIFIKIKHKNNFETAYLHLSETYYKKGEKVSAGFIIGRSGNTGHSTAPHLHFAVKNNGEYINPVTFLNDLILVNAIKENEL